jgi:hypothetical protein
MDVDDLLRSTDLPEIPVGTDEALASTVRRGRAHRQRRTALLGAGAVLAVVAVTAGGLHLASRDDASQVAIGPETSPSSSASPPALQPQPDPGDAATWSVDPDAPPSPAASTFTADVTRLGCHGGETGEVLHPGVVVTDDEVVVTFTVAADAGTFTCPGNDQVPYEVDLGQPLGDRRLVDGSCSPGAEAATTSSCSEDGGVRWRPGQGGPAADPHECEAAAGTDIDVAHEPDVREHADHRPWTDGDGCLVRIDVVAEHPGPDHCGWERASVLITGRPLGARYTDATDGAEYVRDPEGVFGDASLTAGFEPDALLPGTAVDSGYRRGDVELWSDPADPSAVWMVGPDGTERWPAGESPLCA